MRRLLVVTAVYYLIFGYAQLAAAWLVFPAWRPGMSGLLVLLVGPAAGWLVHQAWRNAWTRWLQRAVYLWMGLGFLLLCVVVPVHLLRLLGLPSGTAALLLAAVYAPLAVWSIANAHRIEVRRMALSSPGLEHPMRLVQVSDVHVGSRGPGFLPRIVRRVNALEPDAVLVTGDLIDLMKLPAGALDSMGALAAPAFFAIGNHERYIGSDAVCARLEALGVTVLRNAHTEWGAIRIIGIDDAEARDQVGRVLARMGTDQNPAIHLYTDDQARPEARSARSGAGQPAHRGDACVSPTRQFVKQDDQSPRMEAGTGERARTAFTILMYHRPDGVEDAARAGVDLMLCGHTHNGQIVPFDWIVKRHFPYTAGHFDIDGMMLYVSPGTGTWGPTMRLGSSNEITVFELSPAPVRAPGGDLQVRTA